MNFLIYLFQETSEVSTIIPTLPTRKHNSQSLRNLLTFSELSNCGTTVSLGCLMSEFILKSTAASSEYPLVNLSQVYGLGVRASGQIPRAVLEGVLVRYLGDLGQGELCGD